MVFQPVQSPALPWADTGTGVCSCRVLLQLLLPFSSFVFLVIFWSYTEAAFRTEEDKKHNQKFTTTVPVETVIECRGEIFSLNVTVNLWC